LKLLHRNITYRRPKRFNSSRAASVRRAALLPLKLPVISRSPAHLLPRRAFSYGELLAAIRCYFEVKAERIELKAGWTPQDKRLAKRSPPFATRAKTLS
jgi:hypothetical protein